jgi:hypothetical protein
VPARKPVVGNQPQSEISTHGALMDAKHSRDLNGPQKLAAAMKACHRDKSKAKREACVRTAHKKFGPLKKKRGKK